nr:uncharacterized protein LOC109147049 [Ipomoea trifida]
MPVKEVMDLVGRTMLFKIKAGKDELANRGKAFPVLRINTDPDILKIHCNDLLKLKDNEGSHDFPISLGDDDFLEFSYLCRLMIQYAELRRQKNEEETITSKLEIQYAE